MISNLPKKISIYDLQKFDFGDIEANDDELLFDSICETSAILEFLNGKKNIVIGEKGTGKTAIFRLLKEHKLEFNQKNGFKNIIIPIENNFQYKHIKDKILTLIKTSNSDESFKYQVVWELFLFHKIIQKVEQLESEDNLFLDDKIKECIKLTKLVFSNDGIENLIKSKTTFEIKLYDTPTSILPGFSITTEPVLEKGNIKEQSIEKLEIDLDFYKSLINKFLVDNSLNLIIIIDRLDEFVSKSLISVQLEMLEALISVEREYSIYKNIELKIFLRDDLFKQLTYEGIGYDKVLFKKIDLIWTPEKIREFIAKRIYANYKNVFNITQLTANIDQEEFEIDTSNETKYKKPNFWIRNYRRVIKKLTPQHYVQKFPRKESLNDNLSKQLILTIFPKYVDFKDKNGDIKEVEIFDYFSENFNLGTGNTIPRLILIFLQKSIAAATNYYIENRDQLPIYQTDKKCFELMKKGFFEKAYSDFKDEIYINFAKLNPEFEERIMLLKEKIGNRYSFRAKDIKGILNIKKDEDLYHFCNYLLHIGYLRRTNNNSTIENMKFEIPYIFRKDK